MGKKESIIKREGHEEDYDERKVYASIYAAALNCEYDRPKSEKIAREVTKKINSWVKIKKGATSDEIRDQVLKHIKDKDVNLMYKHHMDIS